MYVLVYDIIHLKFVLGEYTKPFVFTNSFDEPLFKVSAFFEKSVNFNQSAHVQSDVYYFDLF